MAKVTRGFTGRPRSDRGARLPPGQYDAGSTWPVLNAEATPTIDQKNWTFEIAGMVENPMSWTWDQIRELPESTFEGDIHCVTAWSKFDMSFVGVSVDELLEVASPLPSAHFAMASASTGYTTNLPIEDITGGKAWIVWEVDGEPLPIVHGGPVRMIVPHLYFWKSTKWVSGLRLMELDEPGFWERNGYHDRGDPWLEQRYQGD